MNEFRLRATGEIVSEIEYRALFPNTSFPAILVPEDADPIFKAPPPATTEYQTSVRNGVRLDDLGNWVYAYSIVDFTPEQVIEYNRKKRNTRVPSEVTMRQAQLALFYTGMLQDVETKLAEMSGEEGIVARIEWNKGSVVARDKGLVIDLGESLELSAEQLDDLFVYAATIQ